MRKTNVTFVNKRISTSQELIQFVKENFNQFPTIEIEEERIVKVSFELEETFSIIDNCRESKIVGLPGELTLNTISLINHLVRIVEQNNNYYDELADFYVSQ